MQRTGINGDDYSGIERGSFGGLDYQHFYEALSFPLWCIVLVMATGTQQQLSQPHTVENQ